MAKKPAVRYRVISTCSSLAEGKKDTEFKKKQKMVLAI
jgi:hypothetical protein